MTLVSVIPDDDSELKPAKFDIYSKLLVQHSLYFRTQINSPFNSNDASAFNKDKHLVIELRDHEEETFQTFVHFLYTGSVFSAAEREDREAAEALRFDDEYLRLFKCCELGNDIWVRGLQGWLRIDSLPLDLRQADKAQLRPIACKREGGARSIQSLIDNYVWAQRP